MAIKWHFFLANTFFKRKKKKEKKTIYVYILCIYTHTPKKKKKAKNPEWSLGIDELNTRSD